MYLPSMSMNEYSITIRSGKANPIDGIIEYAFIAPWVFFKYADYQSRHAVVAWLVFQTDRETDRWTDGWMADR